MADDLGERTEMPTQRRLTEARGRGQVAKSQDLSAAIDLVGGLLLVIALSGVFAAGFAKVMQRVLSGEAPGDVVRAETLVDTIRWAAGEAASLAAPFLLLMAVVALIGQISQVGLLFTLYPVKPKLDRMNPISGIKRMFSRRNLVKTGVNAIKLAVVLAVICGLISMRARQIVSLPMLPVWMGVERAGLIIIEACIWLIALLVILGIIDYIFQRWQHKQDLKMTKHDVKDERRQMEGDPEMKAHRFKFAQQIALQRIQHAVPKADVVVSNPTHFAVALGYEAEAMRAPKVLAKGADFLALRIRQLAQMHGVPIVERPPLARALYAGVEVGQEIRPEHYEAVAEILAFVYRMEHRAA